MKRVLVRFLRRIRKRDFIRKVSDDDSFIERHERLMRKIRKINELRLKSEGNNRRQEI